MTQAPTDQAMLTRELHNYKAQLKHAKKAKAEIAAQFKTALPASALHASLMLQMQASSSALKEIELKLKNTEKNLALATAPILAPTLATPPLLTINAAAHWAGEVTIAELSGAALHTWYQYINTMANATAYHQPAWRDAIAQTFNNPTRVWVALDAAKNILGGIPLTFFASALFGKFAVSIPYVNYGGVITPYFNIAKILLAYLPNICSAEGLSHIEVRTMQADLGAHSSSKKASMILALPKTHAELDKNVGAKVRAQYKKCEVHQPQIKFGKLELLQDFYKVFAENMRDLGTPVYAQTWFANILQDPRIAATLCVVYLGHKPVATGFLIGHKNMLEIPWASTLKQANKFNINMWMYKQILDFAIAQQFEFFDFGRSTQAAGTYKFKQQWGAEPYVHHWYKILPSASAHAPELNPDNPKFALMIAVWKRMPVWLSKILGPMIIRNIP
jgi:FemAB-related protein (PEP-CTERM system-associated)